MSEYCRQLTALLGLLLTAALTVSVATASNSDNDPASLQSRVRAAFLFNFARFTQWPDTDSGMQSFDFCVVDSAELEKALVETLKGKQIDGKPVAVRGIETLNDAATCRLLYLPDLAQPAQDNWLQAVAGQSVLTVSEGRDFCLSGGMIGLYLADRRLRFSINPQVVHDAGMQMSSRLLSLADIAGQTP